MSTDSIFYFASARAAHAELVVPFLALALPAQGDYDDLKADVQYLRDRCQEVIDWYGPTGMNTLSAEQDRFINAAVSRCDGDLSDLAAFATLKGLTP